MKKISVIVPFYNVEKYLKDALISLEKQTYNELEVIMVNDGSEDNSCKIAEEFLKDKRFKLVNLRENSGLSVARNVGIDLSNGDYIYFFDSDDILPVNLFSYLVRALDNTDLVSFNSLDFDDKPLNLVIKDVISANSYSGREAFELLLKGKIETAPWSFIFKRKFLLDKNIRFPKGKNFEDIIFTPKLFTKIKNMKVLEFNPAGYLYRSSRKGSITNSLDFASAAKQLKDKYELNNQKYLFLIKCFRNKKLIEEWFVKELVSTYIEYYDYLYNSSYRYVFDNIVHKIQKHSKNLKFSTFSIKEKIQYHVVLNKYLRVPFFNLRKAKNIKLHSSYK